MMEELLKKLSDKEQTTIQKAIDAALQEASDAAMQLRSGTAKGENLMASLYNMLNICLLFILS